MPAESIPNSTFASRAAARGKKVDKAEAEDKAVKRARGKKADDEAAEADEA